MTRTIIILLALFLFSTSSFVAIGQSDPAPTPTRINFNGESVLLDGSIVNFTGGDMIWTHRFGVIVLIRDRFYAGSWLNPQWEDIPLDPDLILPGFNSDGALARVWAQFPEIHEPLGRPYGYGDERPFQVIVRYADTSANPDMLWFIGNGAWYHLSVDDNQFFLYGTIHPRYVSRVYENFVPYTPD